MKIEAVDLFYLSLPEVRDIGDGSQDALLVRVRAGGHEGWGECEAAPLPTIAAFVAPMSHAACKPVLASVLGQSVASPDDIRRVGATVRASSLDLLQAAHALSGVDIALWDLLGRARGEPIWRLLGAATSHAKIPYASVLFGDDAQATFRKARDLARAGYAAVKLGWGPYGRGDANVDAEHVRAAREALGPDATLLVDAGTVWVDDVERAAARLPALEDAGVTWLEEPFESGALAAYARLAARSRRVKLAGGEGSHDAHMARNLIDHGGVAFIQIDTGRAGGITPAADVAAYAAARGVTFVNHTFTSPLALSASLQPFAGLADHRLCEYPGEPSPLAAALTRTAILRDAAGEVRAPDAPGLGLEVDPSTVRRYLVDTELRVGGRTLYRTPAI